jgi:hypothetical protein
VSENSASWTNDRAVKAGATLLAGSMAPSREGLYLELAILADIAKSNPGMSKSSLAPSSFCSR